MSFEIRERAHQQILEARRQPRSFLQASLQETGAATIWLLWAKSFRAGGGDRNFPADKGPAQKARGAQPSWPSSPNGNYYNSLAQHKCCRAGALQRLKIQVLWWSALEGQERTARLLSPPSLPVVASCGRGVGWRKRRMTVTWRCVSRRRHERCKIVKAFRNLRPLDRRFYCSF